MMLPQIMLDAGGLYLLPIFLFGVLGIIFWIWMLVECLTQEAPVGNDKLVWVLVILLTGFLGAVIYCFVRRPTRMTAQQSGSRRWPLLLWFAPVLAIAVSGALLWLLPASSSVFAYLEVKDPSLTTQSLDQQEELTEEDFEVFQQTELALLQSPFVLQSALDRPEISILDTVMQNQPNPLQWLQAKLHADFQGEILELRYEGNADPVDMKQILAAVIAAYCDEHEGIAAREDAHSPRIRIMQPPVAIEDINAIQRYLLAATTGLVVFCLVCLVSMLIGYRSSRA